MQGSNNESSIPVGLPSTSNINWQNFTRAEEIAVDPPPIQLSVVSPTQQSSLLLSRRTISPAFYPSLVPSSLGIPNSSSSSDISFRSSSISISPMSSEQQLLPDRSRSRSRDDDNSLSSPVPSIMRRGRSRLNQSKEFKSKEKLQDAACFELAKIARRKNDTMIYLDGPRIYTCGECRTHLTSHDEIISKSFHGRHGRAYLFDMCVNVTIGPAEDRRLITGLHSVSDIFCKRCNSLLGWTYAKAYEQSQKYKEGKFIIEKIHLHMEESSTYQVNHPAGERRDRWKMRSMSWSDDRVSTSQFSRSCQQDDSISTIYEYRNRSRTSSSLASFLSTPDSHSTQLRQPLVQTLDLGLSPRTESSLPLAPTL